MKFNFESQPNQTPARETAPERNSEGIAGDSFNIEDMPEITVDQRNKFLEQFE